MSLGGLRSYLTLSNFECQKWITGSQTAGDKLRWSKGKQPRISDKVPKSILSGKGGEVSKTARRFAWRQPSFKECVTAH